MNSEILNQEEAIELSSLPVEENEAPEPEVEPELEPESEDIPTSDELPCVEIEDTPKEVTPEDEPDSESENYLNSLIREERISNEYAEFKSLFPGVSVSELPDSVLSSVKNGVPLSAAYALYERRRAMSEAVASGVNQKNRELSFAVKSGKTTEVYFSPDEVRQMSASEVKANYSKIIDSMSHWN